MITAIALNDNSLNATIPSTLEEANGLLILESDTLESIKYTTDNWVQEMDNASCEVLICGDMTDPALFEDIADICVTRYHGAGMKAVNAVHHMKNYRLLIIADYVGGKGCGDHDHCSNEHHD